MADFTFLHAADLHLDTPFDGVEARDEAVARALRDASLAAWDRLVDAAIERGVAFVLLAGDLYDGPERGIRAQLRFLRGLERLDAAGIGAFVVHGNHDPVEEGWSALRALPPHVHVFAPGEPQVFPFERGGELLALVHGVSFGERAERRNLAARYRRAPAQAFQVGLLHCNVDGQRGHDPYAPCTLEELRAAGMDYWALGHVHRRQTLSAAPWVVYPGNLQGRSHKPSECGEKGAVLVHVEGDAVREVEFVPLAPIRFEAIEVDIAGLADVAALERRLHDALAPALAGPGIEGVVVRASLVGRGPVHRDLHGEGAAGLRDALADAAAGMRPWVSWDRIEVQTGAPVDRGALLAREDFAGALLRRLDQLRADEAALLEMLAGIDADLRSGELARLVDPADAGEARALLRAAEALAIDRFGGEA